MEEIVKEVEVGLANGTMSKEEAKMILEDVQRALEIEDATKDMVAKANTLKVVSALLQLV